MNQGMSQSEAGAEGIRNTGTVGGELKEAGTAHWNDPNNGATNSTGYRALPGGYFGDNGVFSSLGNGASFWSSSEDGSNAWYRWLYFNNNGVGRDNYHGRYYGFSVRCLKGAMPAAAPTVTSAEISSITESSAISGGVVISDGGAEVIARGVCWSVSENPTIDNFKTTDGTGIGTFISNISSLTPEVTYFIRAYATNSAGTSYGEQKVFTTFGTFTDNRDGRVYKKITIGIQTWMAENLAYLPAVSPPADGSEIDPYYYVCGYEGSNVSDAKATANYDTYGVLYNWPAALTACPAGWHLPTDAEWTTLTDFPGLSGGSMKEAGTNHWNDPNTGATNGSGLTALPGGNRYYYGDFDYLGFYANFWSSSENDASYAWYRYLTYDGGGVGRNNFGVDNGFSARCLQNN
jgi:uncharacterized protein (TIGR02145 family)